MKYLLIGFLTLFYSGKIYAQNKIVAFTIAERPKYTYYLNVNGVAIESVTVIGYYDDVLSFFKKNATLKNNWMGRCSHALQSDEDYIRSLGVSRYPAEKYTPFTLQRGKLYFIIKDAEEFVAVYNSFAINKIPPPVTPESKSDENNLKYQHVKYCEPEEGSCLSLCVNSVEASFNVCCQDVCLVIKYDGRLSLSADIALIK